VHPASRIRSAAIVLLILATLGIYWQTHAFDFVTLDDADYILDNPLVAGGLSRDAVVRSLTSFHSFNWHPLTWISHMLDVELFGMAPGAHHLVNVALHLANTLLLLGLCHRLTRRFWASMVVAAAFAVHPMHVESVAWISERKDVLSAFWALLALLLYERWARTARVRWHLACGFALALSLMAKGMAVTLPCVFLLLDYWPLSRLRISPPDGIPNAFQPMSVSRAIIEKIPFLLLVTAAAAATIAAQHHDGAITSLGAMPLWARLSNAAIAAGTYAVKLLLPFRLSVFYPHPGVGVSVPLAVAAGGGLLMTTLAFVRWRRRRPGLVVGWLWFLGMLVPVIGLLQVGMQAMADRYTYLPSIGFFTVLVFGAAGVVERIGVRRQILGVVTVAWLAGLAVMGWSQTATWRDSETLFTHAIALDADNWRAHGCLGDHLNRQGRFREATDHLERAVAIQPGYSTAYLNLGVARLNSGLLGPAVEALDVAVRLEPDNARAHSALGTALALRSDLEGALRHHRRARDLAPEEPATWLNLCRTLELAGRSEEAASCRARAEVLQTR
jgi:tetratricopeptide (TPR) repeat protein